MKTKFIILLSIILLVGTVFAQEWSFSPDNPNAFVFKSLPVQLQKFGYDNFCNDTKTFACMNRLAYDKYHGMKGYFVSMDPVAKHSAGYEFLKVILENGEEYFYVSNQKYGDIFSKSAPIVRLRDLHKLSSLVGETITPKGKISVVSTDERMGWFYVKLSNGVEMRDDQYKSFKNIVSRIEDEAKLEELSKLISGLHIEYDKIENLYFIRRTGMDDFPLEAYIGQRNNKLWLRMKVFYKAENWLFVNSYIVVADDLRYESPRSVFKRDHSGGKIWEWQDVEPTSAQLALLKKAAQAVEVTVRFKGDQYYGDRILSPDGKKALANILRVYELLQ